MDLMGMLGSVLGGQNQDQGQVESAFDHFSQQASKGDVASGLMQAFSSNDTPPFGEMLGTLFNNADPNQKAGLLNQLLAVAGPALMTQIAGNKGFDLNSLLSGQQGFTPETASQVPTEVLHSLADHTGGNGSGLIGNVSEFVSEHPTLVKTLGAAALSMAMNHFMNSRRDT